MRSNSLSSINSAPTVACPSCANVLAADELVGGGAAICAHCGHHFLFQAGGDTRRLSRKAAASLALGVVCGILSLIVWASLLPALQMLLGSTEMM